MFQVDRKENRLLRLDEKRFSDLKLREANHLEEWLATQPNALGEELLILQRQFNEFSDTSERLDLLALDKKGRLVVIENKTDDSGRDVTWQALKYTAYISNFTKAEIISIYQKYLQKNGNEDAITRICEFLDVEELDGISLNEGSEQRIFFVAAKFRKEVTSTVLWLRENNIDARCFKVSLYSFNDKVLADVQPVIPTPEAADFMIGMLKKESEIRREHGEERTIQELRRAYWQMTLDALAEAKTELYDNVNASKDQWLYAGSGISWCHYSLTFSPRSEIRVEFVFGRPEKSENKTLFDLLKQEKSQIEEAFGSEIKWRRMDNRKSSKLEFSKSCDGFDQDSWSDLVNWHVEHIIKLELSLKKYLVKIKKKL